MKTLKEFLVGSNAGVPCQSMNTLTMSDKKDIIHVEFAYKDEKIVHSIKYDDIEHIEDEDKWRAYIKSKKYDVTYCVTADYTHSGHIGYSTNNMVVVIEGPKGVVKVIEPLVTVIPSSTMIYGTVSKEVIQI